MGVGLTQKDGHSVNLCLGKTTKQRAGVQVEPTEGHHTGSSDITIPFWQQDPRADHLGYQHALLPDSVCVCKMMLHWEAASEVRLKLHLVRYQGVEFVAGTSGIQRIGR